jgi:hypothetical protein
MCGIFGAIGTRINPGIIRALAIVNRERGTDSLGFFNNTGKIIKRAGDPIGCLGDEDFADYIERSCCKGWFLAGHTRAATRGIVNTENAHPYRYGRYVGCHNGVVDAPNSYAVDSMYLFDRLNCAAGDYQAAFAGIAGYWALAWFDGESFYLQSHNNEVAIGKDKSGTWYYSSDWTHLDACVKIVDCMTLLGAGETIRFSIKSGKYETLAPFTQVVTKKAKKARKGKRSSKWWLNEFEEKATNSDPFFYDSCERWEGVDKWEQYAKQYD